MKSLILHPSSTAQWYALLNEAQQSCSINLKEDIESYLVFLLMRFTDNPAVATSVLGLEFLLGHQAAQYPHQQRLLRDVGDKCLLFAGLFPESALRRRVNLSYFVKLGQTAYSTLSHHSEEQEALFIQLCEEFPKMMDVLQATREFSDTSDLLQSFELWQETGSLAAWQRLRKATQALPMIHSPKKSH